MRCLTRFNIFSLYSDCRLRSPHLRPGPGLQGWEVGTPRNHPCQKRQTEEAKAGQHHDICFCIQPARGLEVKEKAYTIIDYMSEDRCPETTGPVIEIAEDKSANCGKDEKRRSFGNCFSCRCLTTYPATERKHEMSEPKQECLQYICLPKAIS